MARITPSPTKASTPRMKKSSMRTRSQTAKARRALKFGARAKPVPAAAQIGFPLGYAGAKSAVTNRNDDYTLLSSITYDLDALYSQQMTTLTAGTARNNRSRDTIQCLGFNVILNARNASFNSDVVFHYAVVAPKNDTAPSSTDFFRSNDASRGMDFTATSLSGSDLLYAGINPDNYTIFTHKKVPLHAAVGAASSSTYEDSTVGGLFTTEMYLPINRQIRYGTNETCDSPIYLVWWASRPFKKVSDDVVADVYNLIYKIVMKFKEPQNA